MRPDFQFSIVTTKTYIFLLVNSALNSFFFSIQGYAYNITDLYKCVANTRNYYTTYLFC